MQRQTWIDGLLDSLRRQGLEAGENQPYDGRVALGYTLQEHAIAANLPYVMFEVRQDTVADSAAQRRSAGQLLQALEDAGLLTLVRPAAATQVT